MTSKLKLPDGLFVEEISGTIGGSGAELNRMCVQVFLDGEVVFECNSQGLARLKINAGCPDAVLHALSESIDFVKLVNGASGEIPARPE